MKYELDQSIPVLSNLLKKGELNILVGSGISKNSGIPTWEGLIIEFLNMAKGLRLLEQKDKEDILAIVRDAELRIENNRFDPIQVATVLKNRLKKCIELEIGSSPAYDDYHSWLTTTFYKKEYNIKHKYIVITDYQFVLTTNYDSLLQAAAYDEGYLRFSKELYTYRDQSKILNAINLKTPAMIHVHGHHKSLDIDQIIFTKEDYNKLILKQYPGFSFALRMLFTRYSTLFVGYGANDPHLEEVLEEISEYFPLNDQTFSLPPSFLVTKREKADSILEQYKGRVNTSLILIDDWHQYDDLLKKLSEIKKRENHPIHETSN